MASKETQLLHLAFLEKFIDNYRKNQYQRVSMRRELENYKNSQDPDIQEIAKLLSTIYNEFLNYTNPRDVSPEIVIKLQKLITDKREKISREADVGASVSSAPSKPSPGQNPVVASNRKSTTKIELPVAMSEDVKKELNNLHRLTRVKQLDNTIKTVDDYIKKLEKSNKNIAKRAYKGARKRALSLFGKKHTSKLEVAKHLRSELNNIKKASENIDPVLNTAQITDHIQKSLERAKSLNKDLTPFIAEASKPYQFEARNLGDKAFNDLVKYLNDNYDKGTIVFGSMIPEVAKKDKFAKDPFFMQTPPDGYTGPRSQMYNQDLKLGDLFAIYYPLATSAKRDQLLIDTVDTFFERNPNHKLIDLYTFFKQFNAVRQNIEDLTKDIGDGKHDYVSVRLEMLEKFYATLSEASEKLNIPAISKIVKDLEQIRAAAIAQLPKEYQAQAKSAPSAR